MAKCALSQKEAELQMSHIYPKFAVRYLRETSNNGRLRNYKNVNITRQDGLKMPLLSRESEQRFSVAETWFANNVFHPVVKTELKKFSYDDHLYYFIVSLLWRALQVELKSRTYDNEVYSHIYWKTGSEFNVGLTFGFALDQTAAPRYLLGGSLMLGLNSRWTLSYGAAFGKVKTLASGLNEGDIVDLSNYPNSNLPTKDFMEVRGFVGISWNFTGFNIDSSTAKGNK